MKVVVYPHAMELGGSQLNAVQLAGAVRDRGHEVIVLSEPGPLVDLVRDLGLEHVEIPLARRRPSPHVMGVLDRLVTKRAVDVVHGYEWPPAFDAAFGPGLRGHAAPIATVMSMSVVPFFPRSIPLLVGTEQIRQAALAAGHRRVTLLEPPVDTDADHPDLCGAEFRARHGLSGPLVVTVCRLVPDLKREGVLAACAAMEDLDGTLVIVGDGPARAEIEECAARVNARAGRRAVVLTGELSDPRPAYAAADVVLGMGGSALRALSFAKPLIVLGEQGFSSLLTEQTLPRFLDSGWFGLGGDGVPALRSALRRVLGSPELRAELGTLGRQLVVGRFSLRRAAELQEREYHAAVEHRRAAAFDLLRSSAGLVRYKVHRKIARLRGTVAVDDANAQSPGRVS